MTKNKTGGKHKHRKRSRFGGSAPRKVSEIAKDISDCTVYGKVLSCLGNKRFSVLTQQLDSDLPNQQMNCKLRGAISTYIKPNMFVVVERIDSLTSKNKAIIINILSNAEITKLKKAGMWDFKIDTVKNNSFQFGADTEVENDPDAEAESKTAIAAAVESQFNFDLDSVLDVDAI